MLRAFMPFGFPVEHYTDVCDYGQGSAPSFNY